MALLGIQFVITVSVALFLQKLSPFYSLARWVMCTRLYRYLHPSNEELRSLAGKPSNGKGASKRRKGTDKNDNHTDTFTVPCNLEINLERVPIEELDLYSQYKYQDFKWLVDFTGSAVVVYLLIEIVGVWRPQVYVNEFNIGFVWCAMVVVFCIKELFSLTSAYWRSEEGGERSMTISFGLFFFVLAMGVLIIDESILDFGLEEGFKHFTDNLEVIYSKINFNVKKVPSIWGFKVFLAFFSAFLGALLGFPGIRFANMHMESLNNTGQLTLDTILLNISFFSPIFLSLLWVLPLSRDLLHIKDVSTGKQQQLISDETFLYLKIHLVILICLFRLFATRKLLQSHLNSACKRISVLNKETGRITNVELQRTVARVFYYLSAAALQYVAPLILTLFLAMSLRTLTYNMGSVTALAANVLPPESRNKPLKKEEYAMLLRNLFSIKLAKGLCSYLLWWVLNVYFVTSSFGTVYLKLRF